jgi:hypothetical protein
MRTGGTALACTGKAVAKQPTSSIIKATTRMIFFNETLSFLDIFNNVSGDIPSDYFLKLTGCNKKPAFKSRFHY